MKDWSENILTRGGIGLILIAALASPTTLMADDWPSLYTTYGTPGLIEMPSAFALPDAEIAATIGGFDKQQRYSFTFQVLPGLSGTFRYSRVAEWGGSGGGDLYDRSLDVHYQLLEEGALRPAVAVGLRDLMGTGVYTGEYVVASKTLTPDLRGTLGLGWGRLASAGGFDNPLGFISAAFEERPPLEFGKGGVPAFDQYFRGDAALFGGLQYRMTDSLILSAEYSSDGYARQTDRGVVDRPSNVNLGVTYAPWSDLAVSAYALGGSDFGFAATVSFNPKERLAPSGLEGAPPAVFARSDGARSTIARFESSGNVGELEAAIGDALALEGITLLGLRVDGNQAAVWFENGRYRAEVQAIGRVARVLASSLPEKFTTFTLIPAQSGMPMSSMIVQREDLRGLENRAGAAQAIWDRVQVQEAPMLVDAPNNMRHAAAFEWGLAPFVGLQLFDGSKPVRWEYGLQADMRYRIRPNLIVDGAARYRIGGNREAARVSASTLHPVRRNVGLYGKPDSLGLEHLTLNWYDAVTPQIYSRFSLGYLEPMFAGLSSEVLWKPVDSRLAVGAELNYVVQREYDLGFGAQDFEDLGGTYDVFTGHVSAYYDFANAFHGRLDIGRYLAGDWGATISLDREFANGWRIGAYATFTDVPFEDFGEGSFDKGIRISMPLDWAFGAATRDTVDVNLASLTRDGGARLNVQNRLYHTIRGGHLDALEEGRGRFWR